MSHPKNVFRIHVLFYSRKQPARSSNATHDQTDYALRTLTFVAVHQGNCTVTEIANRYNISRDHLVVIVHRLGKLGFLRTVRGKGGGLQLARAPEAITVGQVVRALEPMKLVDCFRDDGGDCRISGACRLRPTFQNALAAWLAVLDGTTLADLTNRNRKLVQLLRQSA